MTSEECVRILAQGRLARLGCARENQPYVVPIYYAYEKGSDGESYLYGFTSVGQKIDWMRANPLVCVEFDEVVDFDQWESVIAFGRYEELYDGAAGGPTVRAPMRATSMSTDNEEPQPWRRAHELLRERKTWWQPGVAAFAASEHRDHSQTFAPLYYRIHIERITGHRAVPESRDREPLATPARARAGEGWMRKALRRIRGGTAG
jgi:nitroimidazol reductase NimA-like FMN-containing flavoprotein (pyridoxamine 5'-phosphate oxidase superfamily)